MCSYNRNYLKRLVKIFICALAPVAKGRARGGVRRLLLKKETVLLLLLQHNACLLLPHKTQRLPPLFFLLRRLLILIIIISSSTIFLQNNNSLKLFWSRVLYYNNLARCSTRPYLSYMGFNCGLLQHVI